MATEKITAIVDSIAELSVLELKELKENNRRDLWRYCCRSRRCQLSPLRVAPLLRRRLSLMLF